MPQLDKASQKVLHKNLNKRIEAAQAELKPLTHYTSDENSPKYDPEKAGKPIPEKDIPEKVMKQINHLKTRIAQFQVSLRLVWNTEWLIEQKKEDIEYTAKILKSDFGPGVQMDNEKRSQEQRYIARLNAMTKAAKCNRKGCYTGRGYVGLNVSTGEFSLCKCTLDTINYYKLHD